MADASFQPEPRPAFHTEPLREPKPAPPRPARRRPRPEAPEQHITLCEAIDRVLNKGVVVKGEITISVADVDLVYLGLNVLLASVETARSMINPVSRPPAIHLGAQGVERP